ncbi:MAG: EAL domain-containing protein [Lachnospiraceae bacterium]|nr:EAL domain-containing protein [Lachnospiraceae bacterium]
MYFDGCAVATITALILALIFRKLTKGRNNELFLTLCVAILALSLIDIQSLRYDLIKGIPADLDVTRLVFRYIYYILYGIVMPVFFFYISSTLGLWHKIPDIDSMLLWWIVPMFLYLIILGQNAFSSKLFYIDDDRRFVETTSITGLYVIIVYFHILCLVVVFMYKKLLAKGQFNALVITLFLSAAAVIVQFNFDRFRISAFIMSIMAISVAISIQRPEEMMDYVVGLQNYNAFLHNTRIDFESESPKVYLLIRFVNYKSLRSSLGLDNYLRLLDNISSKIGKMCKVTSINTENYYLNSGVFAIVGDKKSYEQVLDCGRIIAAYLLEPVKIRQMEVMLDARICLVECPEDISSEVSLLNFVNSFHRKIPAQKRVVIMSKIAKTKDFKVRSDLDTIIAGGIEKHGFEIYYQPIYSIQADRFVSAEALIRLKDETYGFVSPALFIPAAEESGAIHEIGDYVIEEVCKFIGSEDFKNSSLEYIEINLSVAQCIEADLFEKIDNCMKKYGVLPSQINLEITETAVDYDPETTDRNIEMLSNAGIRFSLDDYGTGYSNIKRVVSLPLSMVKLDKTLVDDMDTPLMWIVISSTVRMLKRMNKKILAEGIEDKRALMKFIDIGCDYIQGFYFSRPLPRAQFIEFMKKNNI